MTATSLGSTREVAPIIFELCGNCQEILIEYIEDLEDKLHHE